MGKRRLFDKDAEIAKLNTVLVVEEEKYLSILVILASFLAGFFVLDVQFEISDDIANDEGPNGLYTNGKSPLKTSTNSSASQPNPCSHTPKSLAWIH